MTHGEKIKTQLELARSIVERARASGADVAEASVQNGSHLSVKVRMREREFVEEASSQALGLRVIVDQCVASTYTNDLSESGQKHLLDDVLELASYSEPDPFVGPPDPSQLCAPSDWASLDLFDDKTGDVGAEEAFQWARSGEEAALDVDLRITNSEGGTFSRSSGFSVLLTGDGFSGSHRGTYASLVVNPVADDRNGKKRSGYYWSGARHFCDIQNSVSVGQEAARRTVAQLGAQKIATQELPVVFDRDVARSLLGLFAGCVLGGSIWRKTSYLLERVGTRVASDLVRIVDDPLIARAPGSRPFDGEGLLSRKNVLVDGGELKTYLLDTYSARKLGLKSTANASRSSAGDVGPSASNLILEPGSMTHDALIADTAHGLYVTNMMGFGFNAVTGDFSRGASGFLIRGGELAEPVSEVTLSLNLDQLLQRIDAVADDLEHTTAIASPTFRVSSMTLAGS